MYFFILSTFKSVFQRTMMLSILTVLSVVSMHGAEAWELEKSHTIAPLAGIAHIPRSNETMYGFAGLGYFRRESPLMAWHVQVGAGPQGAYRELAGGVDFYIMKNLRLGAGLGFAFPIHELGDNAIAIPLPEATIGYQTSGERWNPIIQIKQNLFLGTRINAGVGVSF